MKKVIVFVVMGVMGLALSFLFGCATTRSETAGSYIDKTKPLLSQAEIAKAYSDRGVARLMVEEDYAGAAKDFTAAIDFNPAKADLYVGRGLAYLKMGNKEAAKSDFDKAVALDPSLKSVLRSLTISAGIN
jgi:tetratricopeptide (TPR) repeat protein